MCVCDFVIALLRLFFIFVCWIWIYLWFERDVCYCCRYFIIHMVHSAFHTQYSRLNSKIMWICVRINLSVKIYDDLSMNIAFWFTIITIINITILCLCIVIYVMCFIGYSIIGENCICKTTWIWHSNLLMLNSKVYLKLVHNIVRCVVTLLDILLFLLLSNMWTDSTYIRNCSMRFGLSIQSMFHFYAKYFPFFFLLFHNGIYTLILIHLKG